MPRDLYGRAMRPEGSRAAEPVRAGESKMDKPSVPKMAKSAEDPDDAAMLRDHHDRLTRIEEHLGLAKPADGFKAEDQGGKHKSGPEHPREHEKHETKNEKERSGEPSYKRKRH